MESKLKPLLESGAQPVLDPSRMQLVVDLTKTVENAVFKPSAVVIASVNFVVGNSLSMLLQWALIPNSIIRYLIVSVAIAFRSSLVSLRLHPKMVTEPFKYVFSFHDIHIRSIPVLPFHHPSVLQVYEQELIKLIQNSNNYLVSLIPLSCLVISSGYLTNKSRYGLQSQLFFWESFPQKLFPRSEARL